VKFFPNLTGDIHPSHVLSYVPSRYTHRAISNEIEKRGCVLPVALGYSQHSADKLSRIIREVRGRMRSNTHFSIIGDCIRVVRDGDMRFCLVIASDRQQSRCRRQLHAPTHSWPTVSDSLTVTTRAGNNTRTRSL